MIAKPEILSRLLLDTHIWIWLIEGSSQLSHKSTQVINDVAAKGQLFVPAIAVWELATLVAKKRITLSMPVKEWVQEAMSKPGIELLPLSADISIESRALPGNFHGDPADRIIVATGRIEKITLMTRDESILKYSKQGHLKAIKG